MIPDIWQSIMHTKVQISSNTGMDEMVQYEEWMAQNEFSWKVDWDYYVMDFGSDGALMYVRFAEAENASAFRLKFGL